MLDTHSSAVANYLKGTHVVHNARNEVIVILIVTCTLLPLNLTVI